MNQGRERGRRGDSDWLRHAPALGNALILAPVLLLLSLYVVRSLSWRMELDVPLAHYSAFMHAAHGTKPYAQLFEISFPGTILVHLAVTGVFGYGDRGVMVANLLWFVSLAGVSAVLMMRFGRLVAVASVALFGLAYFSFGPGMMLQRDCLLVLPLAVAMVLHDRGSGPVLLRRIAVGFLVGMATAVKPHSAVALLPFLVSDVYELYSARATAVVQAGSSPPTPYRDGVLALASYALGLAVPCGLVFAWLVAQGGLVAWLEMSRQYLPLYLHMTGDHQTIEGAARLRYLLKGFLHFGRQFSWFPAVAVASYLMMFRVEVSAPKARLTRFLLGEAAVFACYPVLAGQFWDYHYGPLVYFLSLLSALCLAPMSRPGGALEVIVPRAVLLLALLGNFKIVQAAKSLGHPSAPPGGGEVDEMAQFLAPRLRPGDTVQPLDWTGGAVQAMLIVQARLATRFMYDYHFYHHVSQPFIQVLRRRFLADLRQAPPRFVLEYFGDKKPWPYGADTTRDFPELRRFLAADYVVAASGRDYRIYERGSVAP